MTLSGPGLLFAGRFLIIIIIDNILLLVIGLLKFYFFLTQFWQAVFLETCSFLLGCPICWHIIVHTILLSFLCVFVVSVVMSSLPFLILFIWVLSLFFLMSLARGLSILFIFQKTRSCFYQSFLFVFLSLFYLFPLLSLLFPSFC